LASAFQGRLTAAAAATTVIHAPAETAQETNVSVLWSFSRSIAPAAAIAQPL